jgi:hypothetical protein
MRGPFPVSDSLAVLAEHRAARGLDARTAATLDLQTAVLLATIGRLDEASPMAAGAEAVLMSLDLYSKLRCAFGLFLVHTESGDHDRATTALETVVDEARERGATSYASSLLALMSVSLTVSGRDEEAAAVRGEAEQLTVPEDKTNVLVVEAVGAVLAARRGDHDEATRRSAAAAAVPASCDAAILRGISSEFLSEAAARRGDHGEQRRHLHNALAHYQVKQAVPRITRVEAELAALD